MDYRWDSTAHTRAGWHCVCKYVLRMSSLRCQICVEQKSKFMFFLFCYCRLTLWYLVFQEKSSGTVQCNNKQKADRNKCTMPALSDTVSSSYRLLRDYPLSGVMWSQVSVAENLLESFCRSSRELRSVKHRAHKSPAVAAICEALNIKAAITLLVWSQHRFLQRGC